MSVLFKHSNTHRTYPAWMWTNRSQTRYTWQHNQALFCLAVPNEGEQTSVNSLPVVREPCFPKLLRYEMMREKKGSLSSTGRSSLGMLGIWKCQNQKAVVTYRTRLRIDLLFWYISQLYAQEGIQNNKNKVMFYWFQRGNPLNTWPPVRRLVHSVS